MTTTPAEQQSLKDTLQAQQQRVRGLIDGLDEAALRSPVLPSGWSPLGLLHLTGMHQLWFRDVLGDEHAPLPAEDGPDFGLEPARSVADLLEAYARECANALAVVTTLDPDDAPACWPEELFGGWRLHTQRAVVLHVVVELSTHYGQLDAVRELTDGRTWSYVLGRVAAPEERVGLI